MSIELYLVLDTQPPGDAAAWRAVGQEFVHLALVSAADHGLPAAGPCIQLSMRAAGFEHGLLVAGVIGAAFGGQLFDEEGEIMDEFARSEPVASLDDLRERIRATIAEDAHRERASRQARQAEWEAAAASSPREYAEANDWSDVMPGAARPGGHRGVPALSPTYRKRDSAPEPDTDEITIEGLQAGWRSVVRALEQRSRAITPGSDESRALGALLVQAAPEARGDALGTILEALARLAYTAALDELDFSAVARRTDAGLVRSVRASLERIRATG